MQPALGLWMYRFNGATAWEPWRPETDWEGLAREHPLQWGHGLGAVETGPLHTTTVGGERASMGPRLGSRGDQINRVLVVRDSQASMGPRLGSRGDHKQVDHLPCVFFTLQWGHGLGAVETTDRAPGPR